MRVHPGAIVAAFFFDAILGFVWYSPGVFGETWHALQPHVPAVEDLPGSVFGISTLGNLAKVLCLAALVDRTDPAGWMDGVKVTLLAWLGVVFSIHLGSALFAGKPMTVLAINMGFHLICFTVFGALFGGWRRR